MGVWLWHQDRKKHVKFRQMWRFCSLFSSIAKAWCIMHSYHKFVWGIRNITLKLCADCANQFIRDALNSEKPNPNWVRIQWTWPPLSVRQKRTELWENQSWFWNHVNAPAHTSMLVGEFLMKTYIHNGPLQPFSQDNGLASHTTQVVCVNFIREWRNLQSIPNDRFLGNFYLAGLFTLRVFDRNLLIYFSYFIFDDWPGIWTQAFASKKPTHYIIMPQPP